MGGHHVEASNVIMLIWIKAAALWRADFGARGRGLGFTRQGQWTGRRIKTSGVALGVGDLPGPVGFSIAP
jgi:hypothetical protein